MPDSAPNHTAQNSKQMNEIYTLNNNFLPWDIGWIVLMLKTL